MRSGISLGKMILREMQRSKVNTLLCLLTVVVAAGVLVAMVTFNQINPDVEFRLRKGRLEA